MIPLSFQLYIASWCLATLVALVLAIRARRRLELCSAAYWSSLLRPWKVITFVIAAGGMVVIAPYTGDPTWDYFDAALMATLTFASAPWVAGVLFRALRRGERDGVKIYVALCAWMFSASWCYDGYMVLTLGRYPPTWAANIFASSVLYGCAGLFWNLQWREGRGVHFSFSEDRWPTAEAQVNAKVLLFALPFALIVAAMILGFLFF